MHPNPEDAEGLQINMERKEVSNLPVSDHIAPIPKGYHAVYTFSSSIP
jgi:hypothetical protein